MDPLDSRIAIKVKDLSFAYATASRDTDDARRTLSHVDWEIEEGAFMLLMGSTGCGKTTLMRNLKPELVPAGAIDGTVEIFGQPSNEMDAKTSAETIGYVAQNPETQIVCDTVWHELAFGLENLGYPTDVMRRRIAEIAHFFGIEPWIERKCDQLSGGQQQVMNLASVLALRPKILLLDEPTSMLDPVAARNFLHMLFRVNRELGLTVVIVSHEPETIVDYATHAVELKDGKIRQINIDEFRRDIHERTISARFDDLELPKTEPVVELKDAYVRYSRNDSFVLRGMDLQVKRGSIHALVGGNGCGKSTLLKTIAGTLKIDRGKVRNACSNQQAFLPQSPKTLFVCDTVADELKEWQKSAGYTDADIDAITKRFRIDMLMNQHPYDLSGGQQQLLACAKLILLRPKLLLMDEPTKGLDVLSRYIIADAICSCVANGATVIMSTHDLAFASRIADTLSMIFDGQVTCSESASEFFKENLFYRPTIDWFFATWERQLVPASLFADEQDCASIG